MTLAPGQPSPQKPLWQNRWLGMGLVALVLGGLFLSLLAPVTAQVTSGSTWNRSPNGYSAWFEYMAERGTPVQRWQRPVGELVDEVASEDGAEPATLVMVLPTVTAFSEVQNRYPALDDWREANQRLVVVGVRGPVTAAPFATTLTTDSGNLAIETRRRYDNYSDRLALVRDEWGALVVTEAGSDPSALASEPIIQIVPPHLGANAYQDAEANFALLADWVTAAEGPVWVDEYIHGYRDPSPTPTTTTEPQSWLDYLARTPLTVALVQGVLVVILAILAHNRRLDRLQTVAAPSPDNSQAYITALAEVLQRAASRDFVAQTLGTAERTELQQALGLGTGPVPDRTLATAWGQATGQDPQQLDPLLLPPVLRRDRDLHHWLLKLALIRHHTAQPNSPPNPNPTPKEPTP